MSPDQDLRILPNPVGPNAEFYAWAARGELRLQRCADCGTWRHPPRHRCAACGSLETSWERVSGRGRLFSWTVTHQALDPAFTVPYAVVVVELDEGPRLVGNVRDIEPSQLSLDLRVEAVLEPISDTVALVHFRRASSRQRSDRRGAERGGDPWTSSRQRSDRRGAERGGDPWTSSRQRSDRRGAERGGDPWT